MIERYSRPVMKKVWSDTSKFEKWLKVEIAACEAWAEIGLIPLSELLKIKTAKFSLKRFESHLAVTHHDMTAFLRAIGESLGDESRFIHLGMTSSDVMDTALSLQMVEASDLLTKDIRELIEVISDKARSYKYTIMVGRTHGVHAEPITFGLKLALWHEEMKRNLERLKVARENISVGKISGAVGTYASVPPVIEELACQKLGLSPAPISNQILQRDRHAQFMTTLAIIAGSLEKFATEIRALQRTESREAEEPFSEGQTGSSAMPHKRNPELCERICGLARLIRGYAATSLENINLWHERDISHSSAERVILPDGCLVMDYMLSIFTVVMRGLAVYPDNMKRNLEASHKLIFSQRVLLALIEKGMERQKAYKIVQRNAMKSWKESVDFELLLKADKEVTSKLKTKDLKEIFNYSYYLKHVDEIFKRLGIESSKAARKVKLLSSI